MVWLTKQQKQFWFKLVTLKNSLNMRNLWEIFKHKSVKVKRKLSNMEQMMGIVKFNKFNCLKREVKDFGQ